MHPIGRFRIELRNEFADHYLGTEPRSTGGGCNSHRMTARAVVDQPANQVSQIMGGIATPQQTRLAGDHRFRQTTAITPRGMVARVDLTMTDEAPYAYAQVIISAVPLP